MEGLGDTLRRQPRATEETYCNERRLSLFMNVIDEAAFVRFFPDGQTWA